MVLFTFLFLLVSITYFAFVSEKREIYSPSVINSSIWTFVVLIAFLNIGRWRYDVSFFTVAIVVVSCIAFMSGSFLARNVVPDKNMEFLEDDREKLNTLFLFRALIILNIAGYILFFLNLREKEYILRSLGKSFASENFLFYLRHKETLGYAGETSSAISLASNFYEGVSFVFISLIIRGISRKDYSFNSKYFILFISSQIPTLSYNFLSSGRDGFIRYFTVILVNMLCYLRKYNNDYSKVISKSLKYVVRTFACVIVVFLIAGLYTGKTNNGNSISEILSKYISSAIIAFDKSVVYEGAVNDTGTFRCFFSLNYILYRFLGIGSISSTRADSFINIAPNLNTNIYTAFYDYYLDFGFGGTVLIYLLFGFICGYIYNKTKTKNYQFWIILYSYYSYLLVRQITEAFFIKMSLSEVHLMIIASVLFGYHYICKKTYLKE